MAALKLQDNSAIALLRTLHRRPGVAVQLALALSMIALATLMRFWLGSEFHIKHTFFLFFPAITVISLFCEIKISLISIAAITAIVRYYFLEPQFSFEIASEGDVIALFAFLLESIVIAIICEFVHLAGQHVISIEQDLRRQDESALRASERRIRAIFNQQNQFTALLTPDGRIVEASASIFRGTGVCPREIIGKHFLDSPWWRDIPDTLERIRRHLDEAATQSSPTQIEISYRAVDGARHDALNTLTALRDETGAVEFLLVESLDITERKKAEKAIRESRQQLTLALETGQLGFYDWDVTTGRAEFGGRWASMLGYELDEIEAHARTWEGLIHPDEKDAVTAILSAYVDGRLPTYECRHRLRHKDGSWRWVLTRGQAIERDANGKALRMIGTHADVTAIHEAAEALRESEERFRACFANASIGFAMMTPEGALLEANPAYCRISDYSLDDLREMAILQWIHPDDRSANMAQLARMLAGDIPGFVVESRFIRKCGATIWGRKSVSLVRGADGSPRWIIVLVEDITARINAEQALRDADQRKDEFIATLAHELRNPLTPIRNAAYILKQTHGPDAKDAKLFDMIQRQTAHLVRLVDDLLEVSRISRGKIELRNESVDMAVVLRDALETCGPLIQNRGHHLTANVADQPLMTVGDPVRLVQIAVNLINNAAKYTSIGGRIDIDVRREGDEAVLRVRDTGVGIDPKIIPRIFDLFAQPEHHDGLADGGLGIGLSVVNKLVALHGGTVEARSDGLGKGSEFIIRLPLEKGAKNTASGAQPSVARETSSNSASASA